MFQLYLFFNTLYYEGILTVLDSIHPYIIQYLET